MEDLNMIGERIKIYKELTLTEIKEKIINEMQSWIL